MRKKIAHPYLQNKPKLQHKTQEETEAMLKRRTYPCFFLLNVSFWECIEVAQTMLMHVTRASRTQKPRYMYSTLSNTYSKVLGVSGEA